MTGTRVRVAQVVTRFMAGAGGVALRGALALATGLGSSHPPVQHIAQALSTRLPCLQVTLGDRPGAPLRELLNAAAAEELTS